MLSICKFKVLDYKKIFYFLQFRAVPYKDLFFYSNNINILNIYLTRSVFIYGGKF